MTALRIRRTGVSASKPFLTLLGTNPSNAALIRSENCGACAARAKMFSTSPTRYGVGSTRWNALPLRPFWMRDVVDRVDHEIDRHDVDPAALESHHRHPWRQQLAHLLDQLEEVIRAVDLVHLAGVAVADDQPGAIDPPRHRRLLSHDLLGLVLGSEVRMVETFGLVEHVLAEHPFVHAGSGDRRHVLEDAGLDLIGQRHGVLCAVDVDRDLRFGVGLQVVHRGQMEEVLDLAGEFLQVSLRYSEQRLDQIADDRNRVRARSAPQ